MSNEDQTNTPSDEPEIPMDFSKDDYLMEIDGEIGTILEFEDHEDEWGNKVFAFAVGQYKVVGILEKLLAMKLSGDEFTKQLTGFLENRRKFCEHCFGP